METKKLERIIIIILALLNVFLLIVVLGDGAQARAARRETETTLTALLSDSGIEVGPGAELLQDCPARCTVERDLALERRRMEGFLGGGLGAEDLGGSIWFYTSDRGQVIMRGTGEMDMLMTGAGGRLGGRTREKAAETLFSRAGVEMFETGAAADNGSLLFCCGWNGYPVYNAIMSFDFSGDRLNIVTGTMVFNVETGSEPDVGMDSVSVLVRFIDLAKNEGLICSRLDALEPGYYVNVNMSGESTLTPVWRIVTDTGDYYVNAVSGRMESAF